MTGGWNRERKLEAMNAVLRVAARHVNLLLQEAFEQVAAALAAHIPFACLAIAVPEGADKRLYAVTMGTSAVRLPPFGARFHYDESVLEGSVMREGKPRVCDDTRSGDPLDQPALAWGFLSYLILPIRAPTPAGEPKARTVAKLTLAFLEPGKASAVPLDLLQDIADLFGEGFSRSLALARDRRLAMILETSGDAMLAWDSEYRITDSNLAASELTGLRQQDLLGKSIHELLSPLEHSIDAAPLYAARMELRSCATAPGRDPDQVPVSVTITRVEHDPFVAAHALIRDESRIVAKEREAAMHLGRVRALEDELRTLVDNAPLIIFRIDPETRELRYLNRHAERLLGVPRAEALATPGFLRAAHRDSDAAASFDASVASAKLGVISPPYEARLRGPGNTDITVRGKIYPLVGGSGEIVAVEGILEDVSAEHAVRAQLVKSDRLSTLGMIAASVAHEINSPAAFILLRLDALERRLAEIQGDGSSRLKCIELVSELRESIQRIAHIARDLKLLASPSGHQGGTAQLLDVNESVRSALTLTRTQIIERAELVEKLEPVAPVWIESGRLGQVLVNLLVNATQAIPKTSKHDHHQIIVSTREQGRFVEIEVTDTGEGIRADEIDRIWTPFFTTKAPDVGTGLGLSISRDIIERAGGTIVVTSPVLESDGGAHGARFTVRLLVADESVSEAQRRSATRVGGRYERMQVLIVEDDTALARALADEVEREHEVTVANEAVEALRLLDRQFFDAVLCDLRMPRMSGETLYERVLARDPSSAGRFIFMTGLGFGADVERFLVNAGRPILEKPFSIEDVLSTIRRVVHEHREAG